MSGQLAVATAEPSPPYRNQARTTGWSSAAPSRAAIVGILAALGLVAVALRAYVFHGYFGTDDGEYALLANALARGDFGEFVEENYIRSFNGPAHLPFRMALIAPLAVIFRIFGVNEIALVAYPFLISLLGMVVAFACGRLFFGDRAGLIAAALWAVVPLDVKYATAFLPDGIASFYASLAVLVVVYFADTGVGSTRYRFAGGLLAGLLFGISWLSKESVVYLVPFCAVLIVAGMRSDFRSALPLWLGVAAGSAGILLVEMSTYLIARGDFMLRMHENERSFVQTRSYLFYEGSRYGWPVGSSHAKALLKRLFLEGPSVIFLNPTFLFLPLFGLIGAVRAFFWKDRRFFIPAVWMISLIVMYNFASPSFASYTPLVLMGRYLYPIILPAAVLTAGLIVSLMTRNEVAGVLESRERHFWGSAIVVTLVLITGHAHFRMMRDFPAVRALYQTRNVADIVGPDERIYTDPLSGKALRFHWSYPRSSGVVDFEAMSSDAIQPQSFVLVDRNRLEWLDANVSMWLTEDYGYHEPSFTKTPPSSWDVAWRGESAILYRVR